MKRTCKQCGKDFFINKSEINFYKSKGLSLPRRCKACREVNKSEKNTVNSKDTVKAKNAGESRNTIKADKIVNPKTTGNAENTIKSENKVTSIRSRKNKVSLCLAAVVILLFLILPMIGGGLSGAEDGYQSEGLSEVDSGYQSEGLPGVDSGYQSEGLPEADSNYQSEESAATDSSNVATSIQGFRKEELLQEHYTKHGIEMGFSSAEEYEQAAVAVVENPKALHKLEAEDGDWVYYVEDTNEFVIVSTDGYIRTYFYPSDGREYFDRQ